MAQEQNQLGPCVQPREGLKVLAIAPHPDDIELGCGATIMRLIDEFDAECFYHVLSHLQAVHNHDDRKEEAVRAAIRLGISIDDSAKATFGQYACFNRWLRWEAVARSLRQNILGREEPFLTFRAVPVPKEIVIQEAAKVEDTWSHVTVDNFVDKLFPDQWKEIQHRFWVTREVIAPQLVLLPTTDDAHQDHVTTSECANREFRKGESRWYYEILQFDEKFFIPSLFVDVGGQTAWAREVQIRPEDEQLQNAKRWQESLADRQWFEENSLDDKIGKLAKDDEVLCCKNPVALDTMGNEVEEERATYKVYFKKGTYSQRKADLLVECFRSQRRAVYFKPELVLGNMASRGMQCGRNVKHAEAYQARISI